MDQASRDARQSAPLEAARIVATDHRKLKVRASVEQLLTKKPLRQPTAPAPRAVHYIGYRSVTTRDEPTAWAASVSRNPVIVMKDTKKKPTQQGMKADILLTTSTPLEAEELEKQLHLETKGQP